MTALARREWGEPGASPVVCLHGITSSAGHFRVLAEDWLAERHRVLALDLLGHGSSPYEPPWDAEAHLSAILAAVDEPGAWIGHSFGGRLAFEVAAREPGLVERLVLLDPAIRLPPDVALAAAENARLDRSYVSFDEAIDRRYEESQLHRAPRELVEDELREHMIADDDGRWRYRYSQASVVTAYSLLASEPPSFEVVRVPTLLVLGAQSYLPYEALLGAHQAALDDLLQVVRVPGGHTVLWDALEETATAVSSFLG